MQNRAGKDEVESIFVMINSSNLILREMISCLKALNKESHVQFVLQKYLDHRMETRLKRMM